MIPAFATSSSVSHSADVHSGARGTGKVLSKNDKSGALLTLEDVRDLVAKLVRGEEYVTDSKMTAYDNVGDEIGRSGSWVRKFIKGREVGLHFDQFTRIAGAYDRLCTRIEAAAAADRARVEMLRRIADALGESRLRESGGVDGAPDG